MRAHPWRTAALAMLIAFFFLNVLAYQHAHAMLHYSAAAARMPRLKSLSFGQKLGVLFGGVAVARPMNTRTPQDLGLSAETIHIATDDGHSLEASLLVPANSQGTVVLFHGYAESRSSLLEQGKVCFDQGWAVILVDFRGSGGSDGSTTSLGYHEAEDVVAVVRSVRERGLPRPLVLYGQSMGGAAVLRSIAQRGVRADAIILESVFDRMLGAVRNRFKLTGLPAFPTAELLVFWGDVQLDCSGFQHNPVDYARACGCPALVMHGAADRIARVEDGRAIFDNLAGEKEMVVFEGIGHTSLCGAEPERWTEAVREFLAKQLARASQSER
jgi:alpha-beta hydrolase superfamily lysophospholipase